MKVLIICGSPRKGNSETLCNRMKDLLEEKGTGTEIILLRERNIQRCRGCVEFCNKNLKCCHDDDMASIMQKMVEADGYVFVLPNYFAMPPGLFKDFIDKCSIFYTAETDLSAKRAAVISVGTDKPFIEENVRNVSRNFCETLKIKVVATGAFVSRSELKGNYNDIFENNPDLVDELEKIAGKLHKSLKYAGGEMVTC
ncbi:MAG: flavodoxin family protein [archaeon]|nr:MAG: flavodoxin family protein [archaeon]